MKERISPNRSLLLDKEDAQPASFPDTLIDLHHEKSLGGGTKSTFKVINSKNNKPYVLKYGSSEEHIKIEILLNVLYQRLGVPVANIQAYKLIPQGLSSAIGLHTTDRVVQLAEWIEPKSVQDEDAVIAQARKNFAIHALMGNIDVSKCDNFIQDDADGVPKLIDAGSNFIFRALGERRKDDSIEADEIDTLRDRGLNVWFNDLTEEEIKSQVKELMSKHDIIQSALWEVSQQLGLPASLQNQLIASFSHRLDNLVQRYGFVTQPFAKRDKAAIANTTSAGVLHLERNEAGELCVLLSKRVNHNWCDNFGGKSDADDKTLARTAQREAQEESNGYFYYSDRELAQASFHDIITTDQQNKQRVYRMYFVEGANPIDFNQLKDEEHTEHYLVPLKNIQQGLTAAKEIVEEQQTTIGVKDSKGKEILVYPPLYAMLKQAPVINIIERLLKDQKVVQRTQGMANHPESEKKADPKKPNNLYRPITSPQQVKADIAITSLNKSKVLDDIKHKRHAFFKPVNTETAEAPTANTQPSKLSPSELHLKAVMGDDFKSTNDIKVNLQLFLDKYSVKKYNESEQKRLISQAVKMIENEKKHPDRAFAYHGVSSEIAYAYQVYQSVYSILAADSSNNALRADNPLFHSCLGIQDFIAHFESLAVDKKTIYNYEAGYMESAISANLFLFGNHLNENSNTIHYYTTNTTMKKQAIDKLLFASFQSMGVSQVIIDKLAALATQFPYRNQGALYQISMLKNEVDHYGYVAGSEGVLNPFDTKEGNSVSVAQMLAALEDDQLSTTYISSVQTRIMTPPDAPISTDVYHWGETVAPRSEKQFAKKLEKLTQDLAFEVIKNFNRYNPLNTNSPLMRNLSNVSANSGLNTDLEEVSDKVVLDLIKAGDFESLKVLVLAHPEYKEKEFAPVQKMHDYENHERNLLEKLLAAPRSGSLIRELYGENFYESNNVSKVPLEQIVAAIAENKRIQYINGQEDFLFKNNVIEIIRVLGEPDKTPYAIANIMSLIKNIHNIKIVKVIEEIPVSGKVEFLNLAIVKMEEMVRTNPRVRYKLDGIIDDSISTLIRVMPSNKKLDSALQFEGKLKAFSIAPILSLLNKEDRLNFARRQIDKINDDYVLSFILKELNTNEQKEFEQLYQAALSARGGSPRN